MSALHGELQQIKERHSTVCSSSTPPPLQIVFPIFLSPFIHSLGYSNQQNKSSQLPLSFSFFLMFVLFFLICSFPFFFPAYNIQFRTWLDFKKAAFCISSTNSHKNSYTTVTDGQMILNWRKGKGKTSNNKTLHKLLSKGSSKQQMKKQKSSIL